MQFIGNGQNHWYRNNPNSLWIPATKQLEFITLRDQQYIILHLLPEY